MIGGLPTRLSGEVGDAGRSVMRLLRFDPLWADGMDLSASGFLRSFWAPLLALPLNLLVTNALSRQPNVAPASLFGTAVSHLFDAFALPVVLALLARPTGITNGYGAFVILANWAGLFLCVGYAVAALPFLTLGHSLDGFSFFAMLLSVAYIFALWRAARETVGRPREGQATLGPVLMVVVVSIGVGAVADKVGGWLS